MSRARQILGRTGEQWAAHYLQSLGYIILERNVRLSTGEIDIVARDADELVIVEVRTRRSDSFGHALESIGPKKQGQLLRVARYYMMKRKLFDQPCRIDVVAITWSAQREKPQIHHIQDALSF